MRPTRLQHAVLTGVVATLLFLPFCALLASLCYLIFDISLRAFVTFGGRLSEVIGLVAWWALAWLPARAYVAMVSGSRLESGGTRPNQ